MKLSGYVCVRNAFDLDYCISESVCSLIPICDEVVICDSDSSDGTREWAVDFARRDDRIRVINYPWPNPVADPTWWTTWLNFAREHLRYGMQITIDADEVLCPGAYATILRACARGEPHWFHRLNFWNNARSIAPNIGVGNMVARLGPSRMWMPSDEGHPEGEVEIRIAAGWPPNPLPEMRIFHYGFLRRDEVMREKVRILTTSFFGGTGRDDRIESAHARGARWTDDVNMQVVTYDGMHPEIARDWLRVRGRI